MSLTLQDKKYIDTSINTAITKSRIEFKNDMLPFFETIMQENRDHMLALKESFQDEVKMLAELIQDRPTREEVRGMIREEVDPLRRDLTHHILSHS
jgi:hypothetical protein